MGLVYPISVQAAREFTQRAIEAKAERVRTRQPHIETSKAMQDELLASVSDQIATFATGGRSETWHGMPEDSFNWLVQSKSFEGFGMTWSLSSAGLPETPGVHITW